ncbi:MAG: hypothetical protein E6I65_05095 [Chloroflexi bacterium]|nr:MAG: hypothetical protein E6I65_05095 [Chloroflexota bacterium]
MGSDATQATSSSGLESALDPAQVDGLTDLDPAAFRRVLHEVADLMADYAETLAERPVLPPVEPGSIAP